MNLALSSLSIIIGIAVLVLAITIHEFAHAFVADRLGDPTARLMGRVTLNPLAHLDPYGSLLFIMLLLMNSPIILGWGKPVPFDPFNLRNPRRDGLLISIAGPTTNLLAAILAALLYHLIRTVGIGSLPIVAISVVLISFVQINVVLAIFNLVPIHPLDGFKVVSGLLPEDKAKQWDSLSSYGIIFLFLLILPLRGGSMLSNLIGPIIGTIIHLLLP